MLVTEMTPEQLEAAVIADTNKALADHSVYAGMDVRHVKSGRSYTVVCLAVIEATMELAVVYRASKDHKVWVRPLAEFCDGRFVGV